jgi:hypothetical protein
MRSNRQSWRTHPSANNKRGSEIYYFDLVYGPHLLMNKNVYIKTLFEKVLSMPFQAPFGFFKPL